MSRLPLILLFLTIASTFASIESFNRLTIDFSDKEDASTKATWSYPDQTVSTTEGLRQDDDPSSFRSVWIRTTPMAIGLSWRAPLAASIQATIRRTPESRRRHDRSIFSHGQLYVRYSPDYAHWSSWQAVPYKNSLKGITFAGQICIPRIDREEYDKLLSEYAQRNVPWASDEEAAVKWIVAKDPKFFARTIPFIGFIQFLYEVDLAGNQRIQSFSADISYGMSGMASIPKSPLIRENREGPWNFKAE